MVDFVESPFVQARQILALNPTSPTPSHCSQPASSSIDQFIMPMHQIPQTQKQSVIHNTGMNKFRNLIVNIAINEHTNNNHH